MRKIPATTTTEPTMFLAVTFSRSKTTPASTENSGVVDEIGMARDAIVSVKLKVRKNQPNPRATSPPAIKVAAVFLLTFRKPCLLSMIGENTSSNNPIAEALTTFTINA